MKKNLSTCITIINSNGEEEIYSTIEEAIIATQLTKRQLEKRATEEFVYKGTQYKWCDSSTRKSFLGRKSRRKGNKWELDIIARLKEIGYDGCVSARSESKRVDDAKVDIIDLNKELPCYIQAKSTKNIPNFDKISKECSFKDRPFVIAVKQPNREPIAILPLDFFYKLISKK